MFHLFTSPFLNNTFNFKQFSHYCDTAHQTFLDFPGTASVILKVDCTVNA